MSQALTSGSPIILEDALLVVNTHMGPAVLIPTARSIKVSEGKSLKDTLDAIEEALKSTQGATVAKQFSPAGTRGTLAAYANYYVPGYIVGTGRLQIWLDGILCECGGNAAQHQYQEVGAAGTWNNVIQFHDAIDGSYAISARVR